jgi:mRNA-degrading endonuclease toxin of MazEF toxin-antitoxin module
MTALRWAIVSIDLDPTTGREHARRRALVVSYEAFHASGMATICPISARVARYPGEITIPRGHAGQTKDAVILCHQVRTLDLRRMTTYEVRGRQPFVTDPAIRSAVRSALGRHLGLDTDAARDGSVVVEVAG